MTKYQEYRIAGYRAVEALRNAKILQDWDKLEREGLVKLEAEPEQEDYFDVYGEPEGYVNIHGRRISAEQEREEIARHLDTWGCWFISSWWRKNTESEWDQADSIGMCVYHNPLNPIENNYVPDLMLSAISKVQASHDNCLDPRSPLPLWRGSEV